MKKYEALIKEHEQNIADAEALRKKNEQLRAEITKIEGNLNEIARSGDVDAYMQAKNQIDRCKAQIEVNVAIIEAKNEPIPVEEVCAAWEECSNEMAKDRQRECDKLMKMLDGAVFEQYKKVTACNLEMLRAKERFSQLVDRTVSLSFPVLPLYGVAEFGKTYTMRNTNGRGVTVIEGNVFKIMELINQANGLASFMNEIPLIGQSDPYRDKQAAVSSADDA